MTAEAFLYQLRRYAEEVALQPEEAIKEWAEREERAALQRDMESLAKLLGREQER
jgi:hypothetical protein